jgi:hypothetical protein
MERRGAHELSPQKPMLMPLEDSAESTGGRLSGQHPSRPTERQTNPKSPLGGDGQSITPTGGQNPLAVVRFGGITRAAGREFFLVDTRPSVVVRRLVPGAPAIFGPFTNHRF